MVTRSLETSTAVTCMKTLLSIFTAILLLFGILLLGGGIYSKIKLGGYDLLTTYDYSSAPWVLIGIGVFVVLIAVFGCLSIAKGNTCMLRMLAFTLGVFFLAEVALAIVVAVYREKISSSFETGMTDAIKKYNESDFKQAVDNAQKTLHCCGSANYTDYWLVASWNTSTVPSSCCRNETACAGIETGGILNIPTNNGTQVEELIYTDGCPSKVFATVNENFAAILGSLFGVAGFQLLGLFLSCCLASSINSHKYHLV